MLFLKSLVSVTYRALVLFDIDGTLVRRAGPHHREALVRGVRRITGLETSTDGIPVQGMLDPDILTQMMQRSGASRTTIRQAIPEIIRAAERYYLRVCPALNGKHCPGVEPVLDRLTRREFLLGLVTGNLTRIGWRKLECAGLRKYFRFGAFGEEARTRAGLAARHPRSAPQQLDRPVGGRISHRRCSVRYPCGARQSYSYHRGTNGHFGS